MKRCQFLVLVLMMAGLVCLAAPLTVTAQVLEPVEAEALVAFKVDPAEVAVTYETWADGGVVLLERITVNGSGEEGDFGDPIERVPLIAREETSGFLAGATGEGKVTIWCDSDGGILLEEITSFTTRGSDEMKQARQGSDTDSEDCFMYFLAPGCQTPFVQSLQPGCSITKTTWTGHTPCWYLGYTYTCPGWTLFKSATATKGEYNAWATGSCKLPQGYCPGC